MVIIYTYYIVFSELYCIYRTICLKNKGEGGESMNWRKKMLSALLARAKAPQIPAGPPPITTASAR